MNILLTCSGRRNYLVDYFREALNGEGKVFTVNSVSDASSMVVSDGSFIAPPLNDEEEYINFLLTISRSYKIDLIVPLFDLELPLLARHKSKFSDLDVTTAISDSTVIDICNDKLKTVEFGKNLEIKTLFTVSDLHQVFDNIKNEIIQFPLVIKPRWGMGSIAIQEAENIEELTVLYEKVKRRINSTYLKYYDAIDLESSVIIQEKAHGQEYGLDIINDLNGNYMTTFVKKKLAMRSGETDVAITEDMPELQALGQRISTKLKHVGNLDVDLFLNNSEAIVLEMNARFGGGYPFSHLAGARIPKAYIDWTNKKPVNLENFKIETGVKGLKALMLLNYKNNQLL